METSQLQVREPLFTNRSLVRLMIPIVIEQLLSLTIGVADTVMVSNIGEAAVSGVSLSDSINVLLIQIFAALATGGAIVAAQYLGSRDNPNAVTAAKQLFYASTFIAAVISVLMLIFKSPIVRLVFGQISDDVRQNTLTYFTITVLSFPSLAIYNTGAALFRAMGNSRISLYASLMMNIVNVSFNALTIFVFKWGVAGAASSTLLARTCGAIMLLYLITKPNPTLYIKHIFKISIDFPMIRRILRIGIPSGLENSMFQVGKLIVASLVSMLGTSAIAANSVANNISSLQFMIGGAFGIALLTVVGQCMGAQRHDEAQANIRKLVSTGFITCAVLSIVIFFGRNILINLYNLTDQSAVLASQVLMYYAIASGIGWVLAFVIPNALRAAGDVKFTMTVSIVSMWVFRVAFSYLLYYKFNMGLHSVWTAMYIDWICRAVFFVWRYMSGKWKTKVVI